MHLTRTSTTGPSSHGSRPSWSGFNSVPGSHPMRRTPSRHRYPLKPAQPRTERIKIDKPIFTQHGQTFVNITDLSGNLMNNLTGVREEFGDKYVIVTADSQEIGDSSGTPREENFCGNNLPFSLISILQHSCTF